MSSIKKKLRKRLKKVTCAHKIFLLEDRVEQLERRIVNLEAKKPGGFVYPPPNTTNPYQITAVCDSGANGLLGAVDGRR